METPSKSTALEAVNKYQEILKHISTWMDDSAETLLVWSENLGLSRTAISNKKHGRRDWKPSEIRDVLRVLKKDTSIVDNYMQVIDNLDRMIAERGYKKQFFYNKCGVTNNQIAYRARRGSYETWEIEEIKALVDAL